jgi:hypothetical protein
MLKKSHALALTVATAGLIGFGAPMASAATMATGAHHPGSVVNISNNQVPVQVCGNDVDGNVAGGQVPAEGNAVVAGLLSPGSATTSNATDNRGCVMANSQRGTDRHSARGGLVNATNNQVPVQGCGNEILANAAGGQVPLTGLAGALAFLSPSAVTASSAADNQGCGLINQQNG